MRVRKWPALVGSRAPWMAASRVMLPGGAAHVFVAERCVCRRGALGGATLVPGCRARHLVGQVQARRRATQTPSQSGYVDRRQDVVAILGRGTLGRAGVESAAGRWRLSLQARRQLGLLV